MTILLCDSVENSVWEDCIWLWAIGGLFDMMDRRFWTIGWRLGGTIGGAFL
jgi:hypothetical protein